MQRSLERDPGAETGEGQKCSGHLREIQVQRLERDRSLACFRFDPIRVMATSGGRSVT